MIAVVSSSETAPSTSDENGEATVETWSSASISSTAAPTASFTGWALTEEPSGMATTIFAEVPETCGKTWFSVSRAFCEDEPGMRTVSFVPFDSVFMRTMPVTRTSSQARTTRTRRR